MPQPKATAARDNVRTFRISEHAEPVDSFKVATTRRPPRGVRKSRWISDGYFDCWLQILAPSEPLRKSVMAGELAPQIFERRYRAEMNHPPQQQAIALLAGIAARMPIYLGCFCEDESHCHRRILRGLVESALDDYLQQRSQR